MQKIVRVRTTEREELVDITNHVTQIVEKSGVATGIVNVYSQGATSAVMIQENWDSPAGRTFSSAILTAPGRNVPLSARLSGPAERESGEIAGELIYPRRGFRRYSLQGLENK